MPLYWRIRDLPELQHLEPAAHSALIARSVALPTRAFMMIHAVLFGLLGWAVTFGVLDVLFGTGTVVLLVLASCAGVLFGAGARLSMVHQIRRGIRRAISDASPSSPLPACPSCGFDLRATNARTCPECGAATWGRDVPESPIARGAGRFIGSLRNQSGRNP